MDSKKVLATLLRHWTDEIARLRDADGDEKSRLIAVDSFNKVLGSTRKEVEEEARKDSPLAFRTPVSCRTEGRLVSLEEVAQRTKSLTAIDLTHKSVFELLASMGEEVGEFSRELKIEEHTYGNGYKKPGKENSREEAVDMIVCALSLYFARNGSIEDLGVMVDNKLDKWERTQGQENMPGLCSDCGTALKIMPLGGGIRDLECPKCSPDSFEDTPPWPTI